MFQIDQKGVDTIKDQLATIDLKLKIEIVKGRILRASLAIMTTLFLIDRFQVLNQWYWMLIICFIAAFICDVFSSTLANGAVAVSESSKKSKK